LRPRLRLRGGVAAVAGVPHRRLRAQVAQPGLLGDDLGLDALGVAQQQIALLGRRRPPAAAVGLVGAHVLDAHADRAQAGQRLERVRSSSRYRRCPLFSSRSTGPTSPTCS
jgi:hypothetical protein